MNTAMRRGLLWFADQYGAVRYFDRSAPRTATRLKLLQAGLIRLFYCQRSGKPCFVVTPSGEIAARAAQQAGHGGKPSVTLGEAFTTERLGCRRQSAKEHGHAH